MTLVFKREPSEVEETVRAGLNKMQSKRAFSTPNLARAAAEQPAFAPVPLQSLPVYNMGLSDLAKGRGTSAAPQTGWRYLVGSGDRAIANVDAVFSPSRQPVFAQVNEGPLVNGTVSAIEAAGFDEQVGKGNYEVRFLMVPALHIAALWLVDLSGGQDLAVPIAPVPPELTPNKPIPLRELLSFMQEAAQKTLASQPPGEAMGA